MENDTDGPDGWGMLGLADFGDTITKMTVYWKKTL